MGIIWTITSFCFYLGKFQLKQVAGSIYVNSLASSIADTLARPVAYFVYRKLGTRVSLLGLFTVAALGSAPVIYSEMASQTYREYIVPICLFIMNSGLSSCFLILYIGHIDLFPIVFLTTSMGSVNIIARFFSIFAPMVAEISEPVPEILFTLLCIIAVAVSYFVRKKTEKFY